LAMVVFFLPRELIHRLLVDSFANDE
jgi:hypothetical protein